jgi:hypothetical protein
MGFEIVPAVVPDLLPHRRRAVVECIMAEAAEGQDVFLDTQPAARTGNVMGFREGIDRFAINAAMMVAFPYALFDGLGNGARLSALA